jgi:hypothetical protein
MFLEVRCIVTLLYGFMFCMALPPFFLVSFMLYLSSYISLMVTNNAVGHRAYSTMETGSGEQLATDVQE